MTTVTKQPFQKKVRAIINALLADESAKILISSEGEPIDEDTPAHRDVTSLVNDCYACGDAVLEVSLGDKRAGWVHIMPYDATDVDELIIDHTMSEYIETQIRTLD